MIDLRFIDELSRRIAEAMPPGVRELQKDVEKNVRAVLQASFARLDLVTREEFEAQRRTLEQTRARIAELEKKIASLEGEAGTGGPRSGGCC